MTTTNQKDEGFRGVVVSKVGRSVIGAVLFFTIGACGDDGEDQPFVGHRVAPCELAQRTYDVDRLEVPADVQRIRAVAIDLDRDAARSGDGALSASHIAIMDTISELVSPVTDELIADGTAALAISVARCKDARDFARVSIGGRPLEPAFGESDGAQVDASGGVGALPVGALFRVEPTDDAGWIRGEALAASLVEGDGEVAGVIGVALHEDDLAPLHEALAATANRLYEGVRGCPDACVTSTAALVAELGLDDDRDGHVTAEEIAASAFMQNLLAPDLDLDGDGIDEHISLALEVHAIER